MMDRPVTLVTGATGFLGRHLVACLLEAGERVRATDRAPTCPIPGFSGEYLSADLTRPETLPPLFAGRVARVFHLGAICNLTVPFAQLRPVNVLGIEHLTRLALAHRVERFVQVSSSSVYGLGTGAPLDESAPRVPRDDYARSKRDGEDVVFARLAEGLPATILRPCMVYGPGCNDGAGKVFSRPTPLPAIPGNGRNRLSNVRAEDVARAALHLSRLEEAVGRVYNVADDSHPTIEEALTWASEAYGLRPPRLHLPLPVMQAIAFAGAAAYRVTRKIPDVEADAIGYLRQDYLIDNARLKATGFRLEHPDFRRSVAELGANYQQGENT
ncbi:MAG: NAD-dependent epimerase/dehydratase family protein [Deltaproteobacteria bacterium]|nr:NAD-dependent epimerase/dehydratase family protein [Deltaproteobacteria bacterium]